MRNMASKTIFYHWKVAFSWGKARKGGITLHICIFGTLTSNPAFFVWEKLASGHICVMVLIISIDTDDLYHTSQMFFANLLACYPLRNVIHKGNSLKSILHWCQLIGTTSKAIQPRNQHCWSNNQENNCWTNKQGMKTQWEAQMLEQKIND